MPFNFELKENKTTLHTELIDGISSFLATSYIIVVNPVIVSQAGMPFGGVVTATGNPILVDERKSDTCKIRKCRV